MQETPIAKGAEQTEDSNQDRIVRYSLEKYRNAAEGANFTKVEQMLFDSYMRYLEGLGMFDNQPVSEEDAAVRAFSTFDGFVSAILLNKKSRELTLRFFETKPGQLYMAQAEAEILNRYMNEANAAKAVFEEKNADLTKLKDALGYVEDSE